MPDISQNGVKTSEKATFAAGCFWGVEAIFQDMTGVLSTRVGYSGGRTDNPTYEQVCTGTTQHAESLEITFDPERISYAALLDSFFRFHDPTTRNRQGPDVGTQYRSVIFFHSAAQESSARAKIAELDEAKVFQSKIVTDVEPAATFWQAEEHHQSYCKIRNIPPPSAQY